MNDSHSLDYRQAGVDIARGNELVERVKPVAARTLRPEVLAGLGGFGGLFELPLDRYQQPVLVSGTDGVGTKLMLARQLERHDTIGIDLVAMCVNDVLAQGAEPLFFLDYFATGQLEVESAAQVIAGIGRGCELAGAALIGGETAEMPGMYSSGDYDLAGFCVGVVEKSRLLDGSGVKNGDSLLGLASTGPHSNGYSLIRKILEVSEAELQQDFHGHSLGDVLLMPTRIYVKSVLSLLQRLPVHALAHITGGGLSENLPRVLPEGLAARVDLSTWPRQPIFDWLKRQGGISQPEMLRTFNCGIGMVVCLPAEYAAQAVEILKHAGESVYEIGQVVPRAGEAVLFEGQL